ncbi:GTP pyrophosphokinase family protein [Micromonospora sp. NBC_00858]|uniref:GTP pyrophosphokinase n=1 Tax=Micromonospora sp. NBC_00858 TaxID=2975979 RepID=UPI0038709265|nr:RelA/SpoT domain-containing protein [Micromonospora sp. NBC_00858]
MDFVEEFIARYTKEYDFYEQAGRLASQELESTLQAAGIRSIVTHRAKSRDRLQEKCRQRELKNGPYKSVDSVFSDIVDLAGIRVALYFPAEIQQVDGIIRRLFNVAEIKEFPEHGELRAGKRFSGYAAAHYRVQLKEQDLSDKRYSLARIEIQVASVLMHAWAEVEHDLVYKPLAGNLSEDELAILDQLNGLVLAGEIALERLQKAGEVRVTSSGRRFANHYDLAVHLLSRVPDEMDRPVNEAGLGRVDLLFDLLSRLGVDTPDQLSPYLAALHNDLERRPLAEQIIDGLLAEDPSRYKVYQELREARRAAFYGSNPEEDDSAARVGAYLMLWVELEHLTRQLGPALGLRKYTMPPGRLLRERNLLPLEMAVEYDRLRQLRNYLVHGTGPVAPTELAEALHHLRGIINEIRRRLGDGSSDDPSGGQGTTE